MQYESHTPQLTLPSSPHLPLLSQPRDASVCTVGWPLASRFSAPFHLLPEAKKDRRTARQSVRQAEGRRGVGRGLTLLHRFRFRMGRLSWPEAVLHQGEQLRPQGRHASVHKNAMN